MGYTIPNAPDATTTDQSEPDSVDFVTLGNRSSGVVSGCTVTASSVSDQNVVVADGEVLSNGTYRTVTATTLPMGQGNATSPRFDLVVVNAAGTVEKRSGTAGSNPTFPVLVTGDVLLAAVYRGSGTGDIITSSRIVDKGIVQPTNTVRVGTGVPANGLGTVGDLYVNTALSSNSGQSQVWVKTGASLWENLAEYTVPETTLNTANTLVRRDASGNFAAGTITASTIIANLTGNVTGNVIGNLTGNVTGNASGSASKWATARTISLAGNATGSVSIDGSANATLTVTNTFASYSTYWYAASHVGTYYLVNNWDGARWNITSNHGAGVRVSYADSAGSSSSLSGFTKGTSVVTFTNPATGRMLGAVPHGLGVKPSGAAVYNGDTNAMSGLYVTYICDATYIYVQALDYSTSYVDIAGRVNWMAYA